MSKTAIIYWSGTGNTEAMAGAIAEGAKEVNADTAYFTVSEISADKAAEYATLILGCPAMGAEELEESEFEPFFAELEYKIDGKNVALFGSYGWGSGQWLEDWCARCKEDGAVMQEEPGVMANEAPDDDAIAACNALGAKLAVC